MAESNIGLDSFDCILGFGNWGVLFFGGF